jgi:sodium transport system ATP-binding protein
MISVKNLTKIFRDRKRGEIRAVDNVSFNCEEGRIFGLLGPNGAGKTTSLRIISTTMRPNSGKVEVDGLDALRKPSEVRKRIGFLTGNTGLYQRLTAREVVNYFGQLNGMARSDVNARLEEVSEWLDMGEFLDTKCSKLSTGMQQKVNIARTIIHDPPVMVFDEPTVGLDILAARSIVDFINFCKTKNKCIIFSTHIMREAERLCDEVAIIHNGRIFAQGTVDALKKVAGEAEFEDAFVKIVGEEQ